MRTMDQQIADNISNDRLVAMLAVGFGVLATLLAAIGLYGVLAYVTAQRTREIGIRMALGAQRLAVVRLVLTDVLWLAGIAIVVTLPIAILLSRTVRSQLYNVSPADPVALILGTVLVAVVAMLAAMVPARRAARRRAYEGAADGIRRSRRSSRPQATSARSSHNECRITLEAPSPLSGRVSSRSLGAGHGHSR